MHKYRACGMLAPRKTCTACGTLLPRKTCTASMDTKTQGRSRLSWRKGSSHPPPSLYIFSLLSFLLPFFCLMRTSKRTQCIYWTGPQIIEIIERGKQIILWQTNVILLELKKAFDATRCYRKLVAPLCHLNYLWTGHLDGSFI